MHVFHSSVLITKTNLISTQLNVYFLAIAMITKGISAYIQQVMSTLLDMLSLTKKIFLSKLTHHSLIIISQTLSTMLNI